MRSVFVCSLIIVFLLTGLALAIGETDGDAETYKKLLQTLDSSIRSLRVGDDVNLGLARELYEDLIMDKDFDRSLDARITQAFESLQKEPTEENIRALRSDISLIANKLGIRLSPIYEYALFVILGLSAIIALLVTLVNRRVVNWERMKQIKAEVAAFQKELRDAQIKRDMKRIHKLRQERKRIFALQGEMMRENLKPTFYYIIPLFIFWMVLSHVYGGWVVAWLPFGLPLPHFLFFRGTWVSCGFLSWYFLTYFGFAQIFRKLLIHD